MEHTLYVRLMAGMQGASPIQSSEFNHRAERRHNLVARFLLVSPNSTWRHTRIARNARVQFHLKVHQETRRWWRPHLISDAAPKLNIIPPLLASELSTHLFGWRDTALVDKHDHSFSSPCHIPISWPQRARPPSRARTQYYPPD